MTKAPADGHPQAADAIALSSKLDIRRLADADGQPRHPMAGFDPKFADFVDYILRITHEIWEEKAIGALYDYYANTIQIHTSDGTIYGREAVLAGTIGTLAAYPDRRLYGDEVLWAGDDQAGFYSSHRLTHRGTNRGWSLYGPPTGRAIQYRAVADCLCLRNMVIEEWLVRDELTLVRQLGLDPVATAIAHARKQAERGGFTEVVGDIERGLGQLPPPVVAPTEQFDPENFIRRLVNQVWNWRLLNTVRAFYAETATLESASGRRLSGHNDIQAYALSLLGPFPDLAVTIEQVIVMPGSGPGHHTATRWRMKGTHTGYGLYGEPTGKRINILGVSHHLIRDERVQNEWTLFDEFALLKQIHRPS